MKVTELKSEGLSKSYKIIIPSNTINEAIKARLTEVAATAKIDGFRPGKIPMSIVKNRFGSQVSGEIVEKQVSDSMRKLFTDKKIKPAMQPKVDFEGKPLDGTDVKFTVNIEIMPEIKVEDFSKMKFERLGIFTYSHEENTHAGDDFEDDIPEELKEERANEIMEIQQEIAFEHNKKLIGKTFKVLFDKKEGGYFVGRTQFDSPDVDNEVLVSAENIYLSIGDFAQIKIIDATDFDIYGELVQP